MKAASHGHGPVKLGLWSGVGLNASAMVGVGVFVSTGFMAESLGPGPILLAWLVGGLAAIAGARAYGEVATLVPRSGGEYRYLSALWHPALGYLAGWTSLLAGFAAPIASGAVVAGAFARTLGLELEPRSVAAGLVVLVTALHAFDLRLSKGAQDALAASKLVLIVGFIGVGLVLGRGGIPDWSPPAPAADPLQSFMANLVYVVYAYTGWNTAAYAADEFDAPRRTVPRSMMLATVGVMALYLLLNWVFVANLDGARIGAFLVGDKSTVTLGHVVVEGLVGPAGGAVMSALVVLALFSSMSSLAMIGPRVFAEMARDGYVPSAFAARAGRPPIFSVLFQGALALVLVLTYAADELIANIGIVLTLSSALTVGALFRARWSKALSLPRPSASALIAASVFIVVSAWMLGAAFVARPSLLAWTAGLAALSTAAWLVTGRRARS